MAKCAECFSQMGYSESQAALQHEGMCVACFVKSLVKTKVHAANKDRAPTNLKSIDTLVDKYENILITSESSPTLRIKKRFGIIHGEAALDSRSISPAASFGTFLRRRKMINQVPSLKNVIRDAEIELKANAIAAGANAIIGYQMHVTSTNSETNGLIIATTLGTAVQIV